MDLIGAYPESQSKKTVYIDDSLIRGIEKDVILIDKVIGQTNENNTLFQVDGELKNWGEWSSCLKCGSAQRNRTRECMEPAYGGKPCPVTSIETEACDLEEW